MLNRFPTKNGFPQMIVIIQTPNFKLEVTPNLDQKMGKKHSMRAISLACHKRGNKKKL